jgi:hypothetical protein
VHEYFASVLSACDLWYWLSNSCPKDDGFSVREPYSSRLLGNSYQCPFEPICGVHDDTYLVSNVLLKHMEYCRRETLLRHSARKTSYLVDWQIDYWMNTDIYCTNGLRLGDKGLAQVFLEWFMSRISSE